MKEQEATLLKLMVRELHKIFFNSKLQITLSELSEASEVSPSQIRYWEKKGYIKSLQGQKNQSHKYTIKTLGTVMGIKYYLSQGYTLSKAFEKQHRKRGLFNSVRSFVVSRVQDIQMNDDHVEIDLGPVDNAPGQRAVGIVGNDGQSKVILRKSEN